MSNMYLTGLSKLLDGTIDWDAADVRALLVTASYTFADTHDFVSNITAEVTNSGYARTAITGRAVSTDDSGHRSKCTASATAFPAMAAGTQPYAAIVYVYNALDSAAQLLAYCLLTTPPAPNGGTYTITWDAAGVFTVGN